MSTITALLQERSGVKESSPSERHATLAGCDTAGPIPGPDIDLLTNIEGTETSSVIRPICLAGAEVEFLKMDNGPHIAGPWVQSGLDAFVDWLLEHRRD